MTAISRPSIPNYSVCITDFGGNGNGTDLNTDAFNGAITHLSSRGGGHLIVPEGVWYTGPITLKSGVDLHLEFGAVILFSSDPDLYPIINTSFEGLDTRRCESPIHAEGEKNISITGKGVIDGNGQDWRPVKKSKMNSAEWKAKLASGGILNEEGSIWYPDEAYMQAEKTANMNVPDFTLFNENEIKRFLRPVMVSLRNCENVLLEGCTFQNSPCWNIHPLLCHNVIINGLTVRNPEYAQNGDGIDLESCTNTVIANSSFDVGDDGICIKSGKDADGRRRGVPTSKLIVSGCTVYHGHGGFVVGSEMSGGVNDVLVKDCRFLGTDVGLRFKSTRGRGGVVEGIWIENIQMNRITTDALLFDLFYNGKSAVENLGTDPASGEAAVPAVDETTPSFRDINISNVTCNGAGRAMFFNGLPEMPVKNVSVTNCRFAAKTGADIRTSEDVTLDNVVITAESGEPVITKDVKNFSVR